MNFLPPKSNTAFSIESQWKRECLGRRGERGTARLPGPARKGNFSREDGRHQRALMRTIRALSLFEARIIAQQTTAAPKITTFSEDRQTYPENWHLERRREAILPDYLPPRNVRESTWFLQDAQLQLSSNVCTENSLHAFPVIRHNMSAYATLLDNLRA